MIGKEALHFGGGLEPGFAGGDFGRRHGGQQTARADGVHGAVMQMLFGLQEVHVVGGDEGDAHFPPQPLRLPQYPPITGREVLHGEVEAIAEDFLELCRT